MSRSARPVMSKRLVAVVWAIVVLMLVSALLIQFKLAAHAQKLVQTYIGIEFNHKEDLYLGLETDPVQDLAVTIVTEEDQSLEQLLADGTIYSFERGGDDEPIGFIIEEPDGQKTTSYRLDDCNDRGPLLQVFGYDNETAQIAVHNVLTETLTAYEEVTDFTSDPIEPGNVYFYSSMSKNISLLISTDAGECATVSLDWEEKPTALEETQQPPSSFELFVPFVAVD